MVRGGKGWASGPLVCSRAECKLEAERINEARLWEGRQSEIPLAEAWLKLHHGEIPELRPGDLMPGWMTRVDFRVPIEEVIEGVTAEVSG